jgi:hypothetical protein
VSFGVYPFERTSAAAAPAPSPEACSLVKAGSEEVRVVAGVELVPVVEAPVSGVDFDVVAPAAGAFASGVVAETVLVEEPQPAASAPAVRPSTSAARAVSRWRLIVRRWYSPAGSLLLGCDRLDRES